MGSQGNTTLKDIMIIEEFSLKFWFRFHENALPEMGKSCGYTQLLQKWKRNARHPYFHRPRTMTKCESAKQNVKIPGLFQTQTQRVSLVQNLSVAAGGITFWEPWSPFERRANSQTEWQRTCPGRAGRRRAGQRPGPGGPRLPGGAVSGPGAKSISFTGHSFPPSLQYHHITYYGNT